MVFKLPERCSLINLRGALHFALLWTADSTPDAGRHAEADPLLDSAALKSSNIAALADLGDSLLERHRVNEAERCFDAVLQRDPTTVAALIGRIRTRFARQPANGAESEWQRAIKQNPDEPDLYVYYAQYLASVGRLSEATSQLAQALALSPAHGMAHFHLAHLAGEHDERMAANAPSLSDQGHLIEDALQKRGGRYDDRTMLLFAAGRLKDRVGEYDKAFEHYAEANRRHAVHQMFDPAIYNDTVDRLMQHVDAATIARLSDARRRSGVSLGENLIFIVGMPRSGTTLMEQIVASHPDVIAGGERPDLDRLAGELHQRCGVAQPFPEALAEIDGVALTTLSSDYLSSLGVLFRPEQRLTDKTPRNFLLVGLIAVMFPEARIIHMNRDPRDTCLSCYQQMFARGSVVYSYDVNWLGPVWCAYDRIMQHWSSVLPVPVLDVSYEELARHPETETRRIAAYCGLEWSEDWLMGTGAQGRVATASVAQVRAPLNDQSVGRWRRYEKHLGPLLAALQPL